MQKTISIILVCTISLQAVGCANYSTLRTIEKEAVELTNVELYKGLYIRLTISEQSDLPIKGQKFECYIKAADNRHLIVLTGSTLLDIPLSEIQKIEILDTSEKGERVVLGSITLLAVIALLHGIMSGPSFD